MRQYGSLIL
jgi:hypothetical protein